jgi:hypothetical protein
MIVYILEVKDQVTGKLDQVDEVIRRSHRAGLILLLPRHQEMMAAVAVKAVVQADHVDHYISKQ